MAGAPIGNHNARKTKDWSDQLRRALEKYSSGEVVPGTALAKIAEKVVERAIAGDTYAITEIGNRLDGKPHQSLDVVADVYHVMEMTEDELVADIAAARSELGNIRKPVKRASKAPKKPSQPPSVH